MPPRPITPCWASCDRPASKLPEKITMRPGIQVIPETTLGELAAQVKRASGSRLPLRGRSQGQGEQDLIGPGYATPRMTADADVVIGGESQEADGAFDNVEYVMDAASLGMAKGVIMLGHVISEQGGMEDYGKWLKGFLPTFRSSSCPRKSRTGRRQFSMGARSAWSIVRISIGPLRASSLRPISSSRAVPAMPTGRARRSLRWRRRYRA